MIEQNGVNGAASSSAWTWVNWWKTGSPPCAKRDQIPCWRLAEIGDPGYSGEVTQVLQRAAHQHANDKGKHVIY